MRDDRFSWTDEKARTNLVDHKISFEFARLAFDDPAGIDEPDDDPDEDRWKHTGMADQRIVTVAYVERGDRIHIISARKATRHEREDYFRQST